MLRSAAKIGAKVTGAGLAIGAGYGAYLYETDEGSERAIRAYSTMVPVVLHYRLVEAKDKLVGTTPEEWEALDTFYAERTVQKLGELNGVYVKYCQTAAGFHNTFSETWIEQFRKLESDVPPRPIETVYETIRKETRKPVEETFSSFDPVPLGKSELQYMLAALMLAGQVFADLMDSIFLC